MCWLSNNYISENDSLNEILFLYMFSKTVKITRIGNFLHYGIKSIWQLGNDENKIAMQGYLDELMEMNGIDLLKLSWFFGLNTNDNFNLLKSFEVHSNSLKLWNIEECLHSLNTTSKATQKPLDYEETPSERFFLEPSPCWNVSKHPECEVYCNWNKNASMKILFSQLGVLQRYSQFHIE